MLVVVNFIPVYESLSIPWNGLIIDQDWIERSILGLLILIQAVWFQRVIHNARFFEQWSAWPWFVFMTLAVLLPSQLTTPAVFIPNFIWLILYQKLFYPQDRELTDMRIFMDAGVLFAVACLFYPKTIYMFPFLLILLSQFASTSLNRFYLVILSFIMTTLTVVVIGWIFIEPNWIDQLISGIQPAINADAAIQPATLYSYVAIFTILLVLFPVVYNRLSFMQTQNRIVINMIYLQGLFVLATAIISGGRIDESLVLMVLPASFIISFGSYHVRNRWIANIAILCFVFALVLIQWTYMRKALIF